MKATSFLNMKAWSKIHPPLPQTPRESQQLLSALTSSFRRQLDATDANGPAQSASEHMRSILQNPLFRVVPPKPSHHHPRGTEHEQSELRKRIAKNPMAVFDDLAAAGTLNGPYIGDCLHAQLALLGPSRSDLREQMKNTGVGTKLVEWFRASDSTAQKSFFNYKRTTSAALKFMVAEGLHDQVNIFMQRLAQLDGPGRTQIPHEIRKRISRSFLRDYIAADIQYGRGLAGALQTFNLIGSLLEPAQKDILIPSALALSRFILEHKESEQLKAISASAFDDFCTNLEMPHLRFWRYAMPLYHPSNPNAQPFLDYVQSRRKYVTSNRSDMEQDDMFQIYVDALRLLIEQRRFKDARQLSIHIKQMLSDEAPKVHEPYHHSPQLHELMGRLDLALG